MAVRFAFEPAAVDDMKFFAWFQNRRHLLIVAAHQ
jgi:hypothetical protein